MTRGSHGRPFAYEVKCFQERVHSVALAIVRSVVRQELQLRLDAIKADIQEKKPRRRATRARREPSRVVALHVPISLPEQLVSPPTTEVVAGGARRRQAWTREAVVNELATWLVSGTSIDASFVTRNGPPGLVAATPKIFGRFEAALNVASLHVSKLYPDGPPTRGPPSATHRAEDPIGGESVGAAMVDRP